MSSTITTTSPSTGSKEKTEEGPLKAEYVLMSLAGTLLDDDYLGKSVLALDSFVMRKVDPSTGLPRRYRPADALPFEETYKLLQPGYLDLEHGYVRNNDGTYYVACLTDLGTECTGEMVDWWFSHVENTERYKWWHPREHVSSDWDLNYFATMPEDRKTGHFVEHTHKVCETINGETRDLEIAFQRPSKYFETAKFAGAGVTACMCARVYSNESGIGRVAIGYLVHMVRKVGARSEMRSRFWLGHVYKEETEDSLLSACCVNWLANTALFRGLKMSDRTAEGLWQHCAEEMNCLKAFLPSLHQRETDLYALKVSEFDRLPAEWNRAGRS